MSASSLASKGPNTEEGSAVFCLEAACNLIQVGRGWPGEGERKPSGMQRALGVKECGGFETKWVHLQVMGVQRQVGREVEKQAEVGSCGASNAGERILDFIPIVMRSQRRGLFS